MLKKDPVVPPVDERGKVEVLEDVDDTSALETLQTARELHMLKEFFILPMIFSLHKKGWYPLGMLQH
jgi:hypothetical protein